MSDLGYVVIEFNQASGSPRIITEDPYPEIDDARDAMEHFEAETRAVGRRERYAVATVALVDEGGAA